MKYGKKCALNYGMKVTLDIGEYAKFLKPLIESNTQTERITDIIKTLNFL